MKKILFFHFLLLLVACPKKQVSPQLAEETGLTNPIVEALPQSLCEIPKNIAVYLDSNKDIFTPIDIEKRISMLMVSKMLLL